MDTQTGIVGRTRVTVAPGPRGWIERTATIEDAAASIVLGVSPAWYEKYGVAPGEFDVHATTNDVFAASIASCLTGVFAGALDARSIPVGPDTLRAEVRTEMGPADDEPGWIVRLIEMTYYVRATPDKHDAARRAVATYDRSCLLSRTLKGSRCAITSILVLEEAS